MSISNPSVTFFFFCLQARLFGGAASGGGGGGAGHCDVAVSSNAVEVQQLTAPCGPLVDLAVPPGNPANMVLIPSVKPDVATLFEFYWDRCRNRRAKCRGCGMACGASPAKMKVHAGGCRQLIQRGLVMEVIPLEGESSQETVTSSDFESPPAKKRCVIPVVRTTGPLQQQIAKQICRMVAATNSPFALVDHPEFHRLMQLMRPGIRLPSRKEVGGKLLDEVYETTVEKAKAMCKGKYGCLSVDGWSTITRDPVVGISLTCAGHTYLVNNSIAAR